MAVVVDRTKLHEGRVRARYFRENFAQAGIDLAQVVPELVTNADAAIAASGRRRGRIELRLGSPDPGFLRRWAGHVRELGVPAPTSWRHELMCTDDGVGLDADAVKDRLGALGVTPEHVGQRGLFGRGLRDVWLAQGGGRIRGIRAGRAVEAWFFPGAGDEPYSYYISLDERVDARFSRALGIQREGASVTVPLTQPRLPPNARLRTLVTHLVQLRPVLEDREREVLLELPGEPLELVTYSPPEVDPERPVLFDEEIEIQRGAAARLTVRRAASPIPLSPSRATRRGGIVIRSGRAAHEATLAGLEAHPGARHLFGELECASLEQLQRQALVSPRPQVVVRVDRSGLNDAHPLVQRLYSKLESILRPIVEAEERRAGARLVRSGRAVVARDQLGLRALNDALRSAFDAPGSAGFGAGGSKSERPPVAPAEVEPGVPPAPPAAHEATRTNDEAMRFKQSPVRLRPGEERTVSLLFDPARIPPGTPIDVAADPGLSLSLRRQDVPKAGIQGWSRVSGSLRLLARAQAGSRLSVFAEAGGFVAELVVVVVAHRASGWVREIARKDEDNPDLDAEFDAETGIVTVYEGRPEFKALEKAARRAGLTRARSPEYVPFRMLEVEVAANAVYAWAAVEVLQRSDGGRPAEPVAYAEALRLEGQRLRHRFHEKLMRAFLEPEIFEGRIAEPGSRRRPPANRQLALIEE